MTNQSQFSLNSDGPLTICVGETVTLQVDSFADVQYQWYYQGNALHGATGLSFTTPASGLYHVLISGACGQFISDTVLVEVKSIGNVTITSMQIVCPPETASLVATGGVTYSWSPASYITFTNVPDPIVSPMVTTVYTVEISNEFGCKTSLSTNVAVVCDSMLVPTGFSPNDDGVNDGYVIDGIENYPGNKLWVYNRWGKLVYKATDYNNSWDGISNISGIYMSKKLPTGTYYYILDLNDRSKPRAGYLIIRR
jgi:gliding motility-associated-like protein